MQVKFIIVATNYFTKWVKAEPVAQITEKNFHSFVWKSIIFWFGILEVLILDNGKQLDNPRFREFCLGLRIWNHFSSLGHPQVNG